MNEFAILFSSKRVEKGLSQEEIAAKLNVTRQAVSKWENGKAMPDISLMPQIAQILGVSIEELLTGNKPEKQIIEKVVVQERVVEKPMSVRRFLAIVAPIVLVIVLASALMGVYIPKAIANNTPPAAETPEPEPEIVYTEVKIKDKSDSENNFFQAPLIKDKAYYTLTMDFSRDYIIYITAPKGAVATLNGKVIAEFDTAKTVEYKQFFDTGYYEKNSNFKEGDFNSWEYRFSSKLVFDLELGAYPNYLLEIDLANCSDEDKDFEKQNITFRYEYGFDNVVIPANSTYFVALHNATKKSVIHYNIKSVAIKYVETRVMRVNGEQVYDVPGGNLMDPQRPIPDFHLFELPYSSSFNEYEERQVAFINMTDKAIKLELEEIPIEEIQLAQEVTAKGDGICKRLAVYKINLHHTTRIICESSIKNSSRVTHFNMVDNSFGSESVFSMLREGWRSFENTYDTAPGWIYILIYNYDGKDTTFIVDDWIEYKYKYEISFNNL